MAEQDALEKESIQLEQISASSAPKAFVNRIGFISLQDSAVILAGFQFPIVEDQVTPPFIAEYFLCMTRAVFIESAKRMMKLAEKMESGDV